MPSLFRFMGRFAGQAMRSQAVNVAVTRASRVVYREMRLADIRMKLRLLRRKRGHHILLLGRAVYRLASAGDGGTIDDARIGTLTRVLREIDLEIEEASGELDRRQAEQVAKS